MNTGSVQYRANTSGLQIDEFSVQSEHPNIQELVCSISEDGQLEVTANLEDIYYEDWPHAEVIQEILQFITVLSFEFDRPIQSLREAGFSIKKNDGSGMSTVSSSLVYLWDVVSETLKPGSHSIENFKHRFQTSRHFSAVRVYSSVIQQEDPMARFMFFYNIILTLNGDRQAKVDSNILSVAPDTPQTASPINSGAQETVYTRLRNEIAHKREGVEFESTSSEVNQWVSALGSITKQLVLING